MTVWLLSTDAVTEADASALRVQFPQRYARAERMKRPEARLRSLAATLLLRDALALRDEAQLRYGPQGKPFLPGGPAFSLSHSGAFAALAVDAHPVGLDLERVEPARMRAIRRVCTPEELDWAGEDPLRTFRLWTWKEAVMKATGLGFALAPESFSALPFVIGGAVETAGGVWYAGSADVQGHALAVCSSHPVITPELRRLRT